MRVQIGVPDDHRNANLEVTVDDLEPVRDPMGGGVPTDAGALPPTPPPPALADKPLLDPTKEILPQAPPLPGWFLNNQSKPSA